MIKADDQWDAENIVDNLRHIIEEMIEKEWWSIIDEVESCIDCTEFVSD